MGTHQRPRASVGISGFAAYLPCYRVNLEDWCRWTGDSWAKVSSVIGCSFRMRAPDENAYTMAATAVLRLIQAYDIDPRRVGYFALGTESSTDNSIGAVIVKGMVNDALRALGSPPLGRHCEVPEFKHACLGGVYAMKAAARYVALDGIDKLAIVVCADIAEYARGSSGEATQGAGAVAMLIESQPRLLEFDLARSGSASDYRGPDFRKPFTRYVGQTPSLHGQIRDFPVFNGKYSTSCYLDETLLAMAHMFSKDQAAGVRSVVRWRDTVAAFLHRPYRRMAETGLAASYLLALARGDSADRAELAALASAAGVEPKALAAELCEWPQLYDRVRDGHAAEEPYPNTLETLRALRQHSTYQAQVLDKMRLGDDAMQACGNLYTASMPGWLAAGLEDALASGATLGGASILAFGYGSGDAAEVVPMRVVDGWQSAAARIGFAAALDGAVDLNQAGYQQLHDALEIDAAAAPRPATFVIDRVGAADGSGALDDRGIEYYRFVR
jgi:hydroxymethylglutaryl-CoA synthase